MEPSGCPGDLLGGSGAGVLYGRYKTVMLFRVRVRAKERYSSNMPSEWM